MIERGGKSGQGCFYFTYEDVSFRPQKEATVEYCGQKKMHQMPRQLSRKIQHIIGWTTSRAKLKI